MSFLTNTRRIVKSGFVNFWRNAVVSLSAVFVMTVALFVIASSMLASVFLQSTLGTIEDKVDINVYFNPDAPEASVLAFKSSLEALPEVASTGYISREDALARFRERHADDARVEQALQEIGDNPLGAVVTVKAKDPSQYEAIAKRIEDAQGSVVQSGDTTSNLIYSVNYAKNKIVIDKLNSIIKGVERVSFAILLVLLVIAVVITFNTIRLAIYISREEIAIMRLVGANNSYVRGPFIVEGIMYGIVAGMIATALLYPGVVWLRSATEGFYGGLDLSTYFLNNLNQILGVLVLVGAGLGAVSSFLAVRRYLKV